MNRARRPRQPTINTPTWTLSDGLKTALPFLVVTAAAAGIGFPGPGRALADRAAIEATLAVLVFASALGIEPRTLATTRQHLRRLCIVWIATTAILPLLAWAASRLVPPGDLRDGVLTVGVAPTEVAILAITSLVGASVASAATLLVASTATSILLAGPALNMMTGDGGIDTLGVLLDLGLIVGAPLTAGLLIGRHQTGRALRPAADPAAIVTVTVLAWLVASQVQWSSDYVAVVVALVGFIAGGTLLGWILARTAAADLTTPIVLSASMRDFAIASGIATTAFGPSAAGPLGLYGILVLTWGAIMARTRASPA